MKRFKLLLFISTCLLVSSTSWGHQYFFAFVEIWRVYEEKVSKVFIFDKEVKSFRLDPFLETADTDLNNNTWPREMQATRYQLYKQEQTRKENPMQRQLRVDELQKKN